LNKSVINSPQKRGHKRPGVSAEATETMTEGFCKGEGSRRRRLLAKREGEDRRLAQKENSNKTLKRGNARRKPGEKEHHAGKGDVSHPCQKRNLRKKGRLSGAGGKRKKNVRGIVEEIPEFVGRRSEELVRNSWEGISEGDAREGKILTCTSPKKRT